MMMMMMHFGCLAGSRSSSPSSRLSYLTNTQQELGRRPSASATAVHGYTRSSMPRSQGSSRETSPSRVLGESVDDNHTSILNKKGSFVTGVLSTASAAVGHWNEGSLLMIQILVRMREPWMQIRVWIKDWHQLHAMLKLREKFQLCVCCTSRDVARRKKCY